MNANSENPSPNGVTIMDPIEEVETVTAELQAALTRAGIVLPSLCPDPVSCAHQVMNPLVELGRCNLVELGRCNMETARLLARALDGGR
ncbi:hypothetical protein [Streptomyces sp. NPDC048638]|uniref:hypothetical protein n=1 Tax=Streptomyces sp. NPDC048638 TaxID=3365580 RepID=UPI003718AA50